MESSELELQQNSEAWLAWRRDGKLGSSDGPIVMGLSPWQTPRSLWNKKTGKVADEQLDTFPIMVGKTMEAPARSLFELKSDLDFPPAIKIHQKHPWMIASLDGYNEENKIILEIKCLTGRKTFDEAKAGRVVPHYYCQLQWQLEVTDANEAYFFCVLVESNNGQLQIVDEALVIVKPDKAFQEEMLLAAIGFHNMMVNNVPPPLVDKDYLQADDQSTTLLFSRLKAAKAVVLHAEEAMKMAADEKKEADALYSAVREEAIEHVETLGHPKVTACGVNMIKSKNGSWQVRLATEGEE